MTRGFVRAVGDSATMAIKHLPTPARLASIPYLATSDSTELVRASKVCQPTLFTNRVFTVYLISVSDHANRRWWTIRKRYTDFYRLRKALIAVPMSGGCHTGAIQPVDGPLTGHPRHRTESYPPPSAALR
ncbi:hypothetical protein DYB26_007388 [Aphanomyces astaci]|uniref:PX domain-containing protein n=1 Tax=Aphanomyces astaci TaxID=112090 RepID=A0A3R6WS66_APHAT|nr:hypothetical protein DYB26_007388 [Aphanomyces astaci]